MFWRWVSVSAAFGRERGASACGVYCGDGFVDGCCGGVCGHYCVYWSDYSHLLRMILGPSNRVLLPASALGGALLIALSDLGARTLVPLLICRLVFLRLWWAARRSSCCCVVPWVRAEVLRE